MSNPGLFDPSEIFSLFAMREVDSVSFDAVVANEPGSDLRCVFMWGKDCFNCNVFKNTAVALQDQLKQLDLSWYHCNIYNDADLGKRFGLHGVPAFIFYRDGKRLGRISGWPGLPQFAAAVGRLHEQKDEGRAER